jgi:hypothetical protein
MRFLAILSLIGVFLVGAVPASAQRSGFLWVETNDGQPPVDGVNEVVMGQTGEEEGLFKIRYTHPSWIAYRDKPYVPPTDLERINEKMADLDPFMRAFLIALAKEVWGNKAAAEAAIRAEARP